ncbi:arsenate reductase (glutaredoxin) [Streptococcus catagoni]|uniref:arsenate reductase (glutaredoxin) n=1 Tax=Streptococcus catagoni TaxID=2654874 RepID=UPI00140B3ACC|nr:arsenate reductase (glutaredoxin) [Streptococcus catagoni]
MEEMIIYHNPKCGTSRNVLAMIRHAGIEPQVIEYLKKPPSRATLLKLIADMGGEVRDVLRTNVLEFEKHNLQDLSKSNLEIVNAMLEDPILINRPIVVSSKGTKLCRPSELLLDILPVPLPSPFTKEDGEVVYPK